MKVDFGIVGQLTRLVGFLIIVAVLVLGVFSQLPLIKKNQRMRQEDLRLEQAVKAEEQRGADLQRRLEALNTDPKAVERLARERLGYAQPGETIIYFEPAPAKKQ
ncbi:MAG TPA: septum formation initiator family protein [Methylomirabilota bacterium]|nr:septum formation initiator family protein [Methylomirabilota bacterium]